MKTNFMIFARNGYLEIFAFFFFVYVILLKQIVDRQLNGGDSWQSGDWLINYSGGFIRRGLFGEIILLSAEMLQTNPLIVLSLLQAAILTFFLFNSCRLMNHLWRSFEQHRSLIFLIFSPAGFMFLVHNPSGNFRKEVLALAFFSHLMVQLIFKTKINIIFVCVNLVFYIIAVLSWEPSLFLFPIMYFVGSRYGLSSVWVFVYRFFLLISSLISILAILLNHGDDETSKAVCDSLSIFPQFSVDICAGAIDAISWDYNFFIAGATLTNPIRALGFLVLTTLALLPFYRVFVVDRGLRMTLMFQSLILFCFNFLAADSGRFIFCCVISGTYLLSLKALLNRSHITSPFSEYIQSSSRRRFIIVFFVYAFGWWLPYSSEGWRGFLPFDWIF